MKVCVDAQAAVAQRAGIGRYTRALLEHLAEFKAEDEIQAAFFDFRGNAEPLKHMPARRIRWCPGRLAQYAWKRLGWPTFDMFAGQADVYHFPNYIIPPLSGGRAVTTIHDVSFKRFPEFAEKRNLEYLNACLPKTLAKAAAVITDSRFSAREITELLGVPADRIFPIHLGVSETMRKPKENEISRFRRSRGLDRPYILGVGTLEPRKNWPFLIEVFEAMSSHFDGVLVVAGMRGWKYAPILERMAASPLKCRIMHLEHVPDDEMPAMYAGAEMLIFPSLYEGFGLPPLEAMACGAPVIASDIEPLREVLSDKALLLPGFDAGQWAETALNVLSDSALREKLKTGGAAHAQKYTWRDTARLTWPVYRQAAT